MFKRIILPLLSLVGICGGAYAYEKCIAVGAMNSYCKSGTISATANTTDWSVTCPIGTNGVTVRGISECLSGYYVNSICSSANMATDQKCTLTQTPVSSTPTLNKYCACRMIYPAVTGWYAISTTPYSSAALCDSNCVTACANSFKSAPARFLGTGATTYLH